MNATHWKPSCTCSVWSFFQDAGTGSLRNSQTWHFRTTFVLDGGWVQTASPRFATVASDTTKLMRLSILASLFLSRFIMLFLMFFLMVGPWKLETSQLRIDIMKPGHSSLWVERRRNLRCLRYTQPVLYKQINKHPRTEAVPLVRSQSSKAFFAQFAQTLVLSDGTAKFLMTNHCCSWRICGCKERAWEDTT